MIRIIFIFNLCFILILIIRPLPTFFFIHFQFKLKFSPHGMRTFDPPFRSNLWALVVAELTAWLLPIPENPGSNPVMGNNYSVCRKDANKEKRPGLAYLKNFPCICCR